MSNNKCITPCDYTNAETMYMFHPYFGRLILNNFTDNDTGICINESHDKIKCTKNTEYDSDIRLSFTNNIDIKIYLKVYYGLETIRDVHNYIVSKKELLLSTKARIFDYLYIWVKDNIEDNIFNIIEIIKVMLNMNGKVNDNDLIKIFKKVISKKVEYPMNYLIKINDILNSK